MIEYYIIKIVRNKGSRFKDTYVKTSYRPRINYSIEINYTPQEFFAKRFRSFRSASEVAEQIKSTVSYIDGDIKEIRIQKMTLCISEITVV